MPTWLLRLVPLLIVLAFTAACGTAEAPTPLASPTTTVAPGDATPLPSYEAPSLPTEIGALFAGSGACTTCHSDMTDEDGNDVSIDKDWRAAIMANASRDPYWQASVRSEVIDHPSLKSVIEDKCAQCHTSMARTTAVVADEESTLLDGGFLDQDHPLHALAIDGVSCTLCHQVEEEGLGDAETFSGEFSIDTRRSRGERMAYGPYVPVPELIAVMRNESGFFAERGSQIEQAELCASCHTLYTPHVGEDGEVAGTFPEQVPYLEWLHGDFAESTACQDCHMPAARGGVRTATTGGSPRREPFAQHRFIGGNTYILKMLWAFGDEYDVTASSDHFARKVDQTLDQLQNRAANLELQQASLNGSTLSFDVAIEPLTGHKMPTGFPSRRAWLHVVVTDDAGDILFESGAFNSDGSIVGNDNDVDAATYEPHYQEITARDQVQIYEPILQEVSGGVTTALLRAMGYVKDNRLLPSGFDKAAAGVDFAVYGAATEDDDFTGGGDTVRYRIDLEQPNGDLTVTVEFLYQSVGYRWAQNLGRHGDAAEVAQFLDAYEAVPNVPVTIASAEATVTP